MATQQPSPKARKKGPKLTKDGKITVFDTEDQSYGIRELIDLIRYIPEGQDVFFGAEMIKKTLSSMQLSIHDIMQDGVEKRKLAAKTIQHLVAEISDYQRRIQSLKGHIRHLRFELGEIQDTCHYLLSDDVDLSQYQHILDEVAKSPIEGDDDESGAVVQDVEETPAPENQSEELAAPSVAAEPPILEPNLLDSPQTTSPEDDFESSETLVDDGPLPEADAFVPDAFSNPDEDYQGQSEEPLSNLTDEVFNPDRFDDDNGVAAKVNAQEAAVENPKPDTDAPKAFEEEQTPASEPSDSDDPDSDLATRL